MLLVDYIIMQMLCHNKRFQDHRVSGIPAFDQHFVSWNFTHHSLLPNITHCTWDNNNNNNNIDCFHIALFSALEQTHCAHVASGSEWVTGVSSFIKKKKKKKKLSEFFTIHRSGVLTASFGFCMADATYSCCRLGTSSMYTIQPCTRLQCHFIQSHVGRVHMC